MKTKTYVVLSALGLMLLSSCETLASKKDKQVNFDQLYATGQYTTLIPKLEDAAVDGDAKAQLMLAKCYDFGNGVNKNEQFAAQWYAKAAAQGNANAQDNLGTCYVLGSGVTKNEELAVSWYQKAAVTGYAPALNNLGLCYRNGEGVPESISMAADYFRRAAQMGNAAGQYNLGRCYYHGLGVPHDLDQAKFWLMRAAAQGYKNAQAFMEENALVPTMNSVTPSAADASAVGASVLPVPNSLPMHSALPAPIPSPVTNPIPSLEAGSGIPAMPLD